MTHGKVMRSQIGLAIFFVVVSCALGFARDAKLPYVLLLDVLRVAWSEKEPCAMRAIRQVRSAE